MKGWLESFVVSFITVLLCLALYHVFVKPITPVKVQGWIGI
jgi:hypothetical protein